MQQARSIVYARLWALFLTTVMALLLALGWTFFEWDVALSVYGVATVCSVYALVFRFSLWAQRPPTKRMYARAFQSFSYASLVAMSIRCARYFAANAFVWKRSPERWLAHWPIMLGCVMAASIAFPLVFGWVWFRTPIDDGNMNYYECMVFAVPLFSFPIDSFMAFMIFHGLVWASFPVLFGVCMAFIRRLRHRGDQAVQSFVDDFLPLIVLFVIAVSGLLLSVSYTWYDGYAHQEIAIFHVIVVVLCILWLPYSKLLHVPQRTLKLAHIINVESAQGEELQAQCMRCQKGFAPAWQIEDLKQVESELDLSYNFSDKTHYQDLCPQCRRANFILAQGQRWKTVKECVDDKNT